MRRKTKERIWNLVAIATIIILPLTIFIGIFGTIGFVITPYETGETFTETVEVTKCWSSSNFLGTWFHFHANSSIDPHSDCFDSEYPLEIGDLLLLEWHEEQYRFGSSVWRLTNWSEWNSKMKKE